MRLARVHYLIPFEINSRNVEVATLTNSACDAATLDAPAYAGDGNCATWPRGFPRTRCTAPHPTPRKLPGCMTEAVLKEPTLLSLINSKNENRQQRFGALAALHKVYQVCLPPNQAPRSAPPVREAGSRPHRHVAPACAALQLTPHVGRYITRHLPPSFTPCSSLSSKPSNCAFKLLKGRSPPTCSRRGGSV